MEFKTKATSKENEKKDKKRHLQPLQPGGVPKRKLPRWNLEEKNVKENLNEKES